MFESCIPQGQRTPAEAAAPSLTLPHHLYAALVLDPPSFRVFADFPAVPVEPDRPIQDEFVVLGDGGVELEFGDGPSANHK